MNLDDRITAKLIEYKEFKLDAITTIAEKLYHCIENNLFDAIGEHTILVKIDVNFELTDYYIKDSFDMLSQAIVQILGERYALESVDKLTFYCLFLTIKKSN